MGSALIVPASRAGADKISEWLGAAYTCAVADTVTGARAMLAAGRFALLVVNAPLADGNGKALCMGEGVYALLIVHESRYEVACARMEPRGVLTLPKSISPLLFAQAVALLRASRARVERLSAKLDEVRIVERAKWALMQTLQMSEAQAHRYIEKRVVAENIVKTYEY